MSDPDRLLTGSPQEILSASIPQRQQFHARLLDQVQEAVIAKDLSGRVIYWNRFAESLYGWSAQEALGRNAMELIPSRDSRIDAENMMNVLRSGGTWSGELILKRRDGTTFPAHVSDGPLCDEQGNLIGIVGISYDITPRRHAEQKQALLIRELHHRVKNTLSTVQALMVTTARTAMSIEEFQTSFFGRVAALARTHALLTDDQWQSAAFSDLLRVELEPYDDGTATRIVLEGPATQLPSLIAVPLGMAIHELTTNAAKHGSLGTPNGSLVVRWREVSDGGRKLCCDWNEHDGPPVELPTREGFGTKLLRRVLTAQLGADVQIDFEPDGLHVFISLPLENDASSDSQ
jgi:PAS domain S-box-containing protein